MDFLDPNKKRQHKLRLFTGYILIAIAIALASLILLFQSYGFDLDRHTGRVIQNGLIFAVAHPESASIYLNGKLNDNRTDARLAVPAGEYRVELKRDGYREWKRSFYLEGGGIVRLDYPLLFPQKLTPKDVQLYSTVPALITNSPDRHWIVVERPGSLTDFDVFDTSSSQAVAQTVSLPAGVLTASDKAQHIELAEWSSDNRHLLLIHHFGDAQEYILLDRESPASSININTVFSLNPTKVTLRDKSSDKFYFFDNSAKTLQTADLKTKQVAPYLSHVLAHKTHDSQTVLYLSDDSPKTGTHAIKMWDGSKSYVLRTTDSDDVLLDAARYNNHWYIVVAVKKEGRVQIYKDPVETLKQDPSEVLSTASVLKLENPQSITFSANARFVASQSGGRFAIFDAEEKRRYYYDIPLPDNADAKASWMDGHRLLQVNSGNVQVFDFDGVNQQTLVPAAAGLPIAFDKDYTAMYSLGPSAVVPGKPALSRTSLKVGP